MSCWILLDWSIWKFMGIKIVDDIYLEAGTKFENIQAMYSDNFVRHMHEKTETLIGIEKRYSCVYLAKGTELSTNWTIIWIGYSNISRKNYSRCQSISSWRSFTVILIWLPTNWWSLNCLVRKRCISRHPNPNQKRGISKKQNLSNNESMRDINHYHFS